MQIIMKVKIIEIKKSIIDRKIRKINFNVCIEAAKRLEITEVSVYGCFILCSYLFLHKTFIIERFYIKFTKNIDYYAKM